MMLERNSNGTQNNIPFRPKSNVYLARHNMFLKWSMNPIHSSYVSLLDNLGEEVDVNNLRELLKQKQERTSAIPTCLSSVFHVTN